MDLNRLYTLHQLTLMRAASTHFAARRIACLATAERLAGRIARIQHRLGAAAAGNWARNGAGREARQADRAILA